MARQHTGPPPPAPAPGNRRRQGPKTAAPLRGWGRFPIDMCLYARTVPQGLCHV